MNVGRNTGDTTGKDFPGFRGELGKQVGVLIVQLIHRDVHPATGKTTVGTTEVGEAFSGLGLAHSG